MEYSPRTAWSLFNAFTAVIGRHSFSLQFTTYLVAAVVSLIGGVVFLVRIPHRRAEPRSSRRLSE